MINVKIISAFGNSFGSSVAAVAEYAHGDPVVLGGGAEPALHVVTRSLDIDSVCVLGV